MISIKYNKNFINVSGHALSNTLGKDLVCAGVSAIVIGAINWFNQKDIELLIDEKQPLIEIKIIDETQCNLNKLNLIIIQLCSLKQNYSDYIMIRKE